MENHILRECHLADKKVVAITIYLDEKYPLGELFGHLQANTDRFRNVLCTEPRRGPQGLRVPRAGQGDAGRRGQGGGRGEVPGWQDEGAEAGVGSSLQQRVIWQP